MANKRSPKMIQHCEKDFELVGELSSAPRSEVWLKRRIPNQHLPHHENRTTISNFMTHFPIGPFPKDLSRIERRWYSIMTRGNHWLLEIST
jgi:hypothetical protein